uniref:Cilia- and flagella-associated protein 263 n=1 Tax=Hanusia phi TaxID=3032 RepID=A0A7S0ENZ4_9CRYP|mmetsp:Transcript_26379/g.59966  ORF Transcript_26379/g.59966 Transcript_26379/m.59966 type:complete len:337 (+) Transcript_26379:30-1040(+)
MAGEASVADLELVQRETRALEAENHMLMQVIDSLNLTEPAGKVELDTPSAGKQKKKQDKEATAKAVPVSLTVNEKLTLANGVSDEQRKQLNQVRSKFDKIVDSLQAQIDTQEEIITNTMMDQIQFRQNFLKDGQPVNQSKLIGFLEDSLRRKDNELDKLETKNRGLRAILSKSEEDLKHKEEAGESLKKIDFEQLQIENKQLLENIDLRNAEALSLKSTLGRAQWRLNKIKEELSQTQQSTDWLVKTEQTKKEQMENIHVELEQVQAMLVKEQNAQKTLQKQLETSNNIPPVIEYIAQGDQLINLKKKIALLTTKISIGEGQLKQTRRTIMRQQGE